MVNNEKKVFSETTEKKVVEAKIKALRFNLAKCSQHAEFADECLAIKKEIRMLEDQLENI